MKKRVKVKIVSPKYKKITMILKLLFIVCLIGVVLFLLFSMKDNKSEKEKIISSKDIKIMEEYISLLKVKNNKFYEEHQYYLDYIELNEGAVYDYDVYCRDGYINYDGSIYLNKCSIDGREIFYSYGTKKKDKEIEKDKDKVDTKKYVYEKNGVATLDVPKDDTGYEKYEIKNDGSMYELLNDYGSYLFFVDHNYCGQLINYVTNEKILSNVTYDAVYPIFLSDSKKYDNNYIIVRINDRLSVYNINNGTKVGTDYESFDVYGRETSVAPKTQLETLVGNNLIVQNNGKCGVVDYVTGRAVVPIQYDTIYKENNYLVVDNDVYDFYGNSIFNNTYSKVYGVSEKLFVFVNDNGNYKIVDINKNVKYDFGKVESDSEIVLRNSYITDESVVFSCYAKKNNVSYIYHFEYNFSNNTGNIRESKN